MDENGDAILLERLRFFAHHGATSAEQARPQPFVVDVVLATDLREAGQSDELARTINYSEIHRRVRAIVEGPPKHLIEALAEAIAADLLATFDRLAAVTVTVRKPEVPRRDPSLGQVGVRIQRRREARQ